MHDMAVSRVSPWSMTLHVAQSFFFQAEDGIRDYKVTGVQTCALPIYSQLRDAGEFRFLHCPDSKLGRPGPERGSKIECDSKSVGSHQQSANGHSSEKPEIGRASCRERV